MNPRNPNSKRRILGLRRALMLGLPLVLAGVAWRIEQIHQMRTPVDIHLPSPGWMRQADGKLMRQPYGGFVLNPQKTPVFHQLVARMRDEVHKHPFAVSISVSQSTQWPKESGLLLFVGQSLDLDRKSGTLRYTTDNYGWAYSKVEDRGIELLARANLPENPITLPANLNKQLHHYGWALTEHYLP